MFDHLVSSILGWGTKYNTMRPEVQANTAQQANKKKAVR